MFAAHLNLSVAAFSLTHSGEEVRQIVIDQPTDFNLRVKITVGSPDAIVAFTDDDSSANYEYRFYLSRNVDTVQYQIGETHNAVYTVIYIQCMGVYCVTYAYFGRWHIYRYKMCVF